MTFSSCYFCMYVIIILHILNNFGYLVFDSITSWQAYLLILDLQLCPSMYLVSFKFSQISFLIICNLLNRIICIKIKHYPRGSLFLNYVPYHGGVLFIHPNIFHLIYLWRNPICLSFAKPINPFNLNIGTQNIVFYFFEVTDRWKKHITLLTMEQNFLWKKKLVFSYSDCWRMIIFQGWIY